MPEKQGYGLQGLIGVWVNEGPADCSLLQRGSKKKQERVSLLNEAVLNRHSGFFDRELYLCCEQHMQLALLHAYADLALGSGPAEGFLDTALEFIDLTAKELLFVSESSENQSLSALCDKVVGFSEKSLEGCFDSSYQQSLLFAEGAALYWQGILLGEKERLYRAVEVLESFLPFLEKEKKVFLARVYESLAQRSSLVEQWDLFKKSSALYAEAIDEGAPNIIDYVSVANRFLAEGPSGQLGEFRSMVLANIDRWLVQRPEEKKDLLEYRLGVQTQQGFGYQD